MNKIQESEKIYHSCLHKNKDGSNKLFQKGDQCCLPTHSPFWKLRGTLQVALERALKKKKQERVTIEEFNYYFQNL